MINMDFVHKFDFVSNEEMVAILTALNNCESVTGWASETERRGAVWYTQTAAPHSTS